MTAAANRGTPPRYLLVEGENGIGESGVFLVCRGAHARDWQTLAPALANPLLARWPRGITGGRSHLSPVGVVRLAAGDRAGDAAATEAERLRRAAAARDARVRRLDDLCDWAFAGGDIDRVDGARAAWLHAPRPEFGGRSAFRAAEQSEEALVTAAALLEAAARDREARQAAGWHLDLEPDAARRAGRAAPQPPYGATASFTPYLRVHATLTGHLHERGRHAAVVTLVGQHPAAYPARPHSGGAAPSGSTIEGNAIAWVGSDAGAPARLAAAAAAFEAEDRDPRERAARPMTAPEQVAYFLWELAARALRDARPAGPDAPGANGGGAGGAS